jgi:hypothetical protein
MALLSLGYGLLAGEFVLQDSGGFCVAKRSERAAVGAVTLDEALGLFDEAAVEHGGGALIDALVEAGTRRVKAEAQDAVSGEGIAAFLPLLGERAVGMERDFDGADHFGDVVGVDGGCCDGVETGKEPVKVRGAAGEGKFTQAITLASFLGRRRKQAVDECAQIEACSSGDDGEAASFGDGGEIFARLTAVVAGSAGFVRPRDVDHMVLDQSSLFAGGLGGADLHLAVDGYGVATDDLAVELLGEANGERGFAARSRADEDDERVGVRCHHRRHQPGVKMLCRPARRRLKRRTAKASTKRPRTWRRRSIRRGVVGGWDISFESASAG